MTSDPIDQPKVPIIPFRQRSKDVYLVYGWKVGIQERNVVLFEKGEEATQLGISLTISADGQKFFVGQHITTLKPAQGEDYVGCVVPGPLMDVDLVEKMAALGIKTPLDNPMLYMILG